MADIDLDYDDIVSENSEQSEIFESEDDQSSDTSSSSAEDSDIDEMIGIDEDIKERTHAEAIKSLKLEVLQQECQRTLTHMPYGTFHEVSASIAVLKMVRQGFIALPLTNPGQNIHSAIIDFTAKNPHVLRNHMVETTAEQRVVSVPALNFVEMKGHTITHNGREMKTYVTPNSESLFRSFMS